MPTPGSFDLLTATDLLCNLAREYASLEQDDDGGRRTQTVEMRYR
jgi:hypothetical protein